MHHRRIFLACYAASGAAALIYQVVWVRLFGLALGHTVASSSIVLAAFMCGLAAGAALAGRVTTMPRRSLQRYAALELFIALFGLVLPALLALSEPWLARAYADGEEPGRFLIVRAALSFAILGLPSVAMGATFPLAVASLSGSAGQHPAGQSQGADDAARLYVANTAGAAAGAVAAGFWIIPSYGMRAATWMAVALNLLSAAIALRLSRVEPENRTNAARRTSSPRTRGRIEREEPWRVPAAIAAALSGFAALVFEVGWTRLIALIIGPTTYAFALMAGSFIVGISLGSRFGLRLARTGSRRALWLCAMLALSAVATLGAAWFTALQLPLIVARYVNEASAFGPLLVREALVLGVTLIAASAGFGATFTLALALGAAGTDRPARDSARVYVLNTAGAVAGALAGGFVLLPRFGIEMTFLVTSRLLIATAAALAAACALRWRALRWSASMMAAGVACVLLGTFALPGWNRDLLASGFYKYSRGVNVEDIEIGARAGQLEYYKEGAAGTVSVKSLAGTRSLAIDGKVDASNGGDMLTQRLLGVLPMLAHHDARAALVIGLGSGVTAAAARATQAVRQLDIVEISPEVAEAAALFERENDRILRGVGARLLLGDGRTHLQLTSRQYDVIVSEPSNPWMAGVAALFTREFFEAVRRRLTADGVFCQWTHTYELEADDLRSIVATFAAVFPNATMWLVGDGDLLLIGARNDAEQLLQNIDRRSRQAPLQPLLDQGVARESIPFFLMSLYAGGPAELVSFARGAVLQEDDRMALEFSAARAMYAPPQGSAARLRTAAVRTKGGERVDAVLSAARADDWINRGDVAFRAEALEMAHDSYRRAADLDRRSIGALRGAASAAAALGRLEEEISWLRDRSHAKADHLAATVALSSALAMKGDLEAAATAAADATRVDPAEPLALEQLASVASDLGDVDRLAPAAEALIARFPERPDSRYYKAAVLFMRGRIREAKAETALLLERHPAHARGHNLMGIVCASTDDFACARSAFEASLRANPRDASVYANLGNMHLEMGDREAAIRWFSEALAVDPGATAARETLRTIAPR